MKNTFPILVLLFCSIVKAGSISTVSNVLTNGSAVSYFSLRCPERSVAIGGGCELLSSEFTRNSGGIPKLLFLQSAAADNVSFQCQYYNDARLQINVRITAKCYSE